MQPISHRTALLMLILLVALQMAIDHYAPEEEPEPPQETDIWTPEDEVNREPENKLCPPMRKP
jgi:hypothetical protein